MPPFLAVATGGEFRVRGRKVFKGDKKGRDLNINKDPETLNPQKGVNTLPLMQSVQKAVCLA